MMSIFKDTLKEEVNRLNQLKGKYEKELESYPKGTLSGKSRGGKLYYYLAYRINKKIKFDYVGKEGSEKVLSMKGLISKRQTIENKLKQVKNELKDISKSINEK
jgi:hypothetical protein